LTLRSPLTRVRAVGILLLLAIASCMVASPVAAQQDSITIAGANPRENAVLADAPAEVSVTFSAAVDPASSRVRLIGPDGDEVAGTSLTWTAPDTATLAPTGDLPHGSWLVAWDVAGDASDVSGSGFFGFTVGADQDVAPLTIPNTGFAASGGSAWLAATGGAALLLGICLLVALLPVRLLLSITVPRSDVTAIGGAALATIGALAWLAALAWDDPHASPDDRLLAVLGDDTGRILLATLALVSLHSLALTLPDRRLAWGTTVALPVPLALLSHAADEPAARIPALTVAWIAVVALALLTGGVIAIARIGGRDAGRLPLAIAIALPAVAIAGGYLLWLFGGDRAAIESTTYGRVAMAALALYAFFAVALIVALPLARRSGTGWPLAIPAIAVIALVGCIGSLMTIDTAREEVTRAASQRALPLTIGDDRAQLILAPGTAGVNHVRLELNRPALPRTTSAALTMTLPSQPQIGAQTVTLARVSGNAFEYHGTEMVIADRWDLEVAVAEPGRDPDRATTSLDLGATAERADVPGVPWRFTDFAGSAGFVMIVVGIAGIAIGVAAGKSRLRMESAGIGVGALLLAAILLGQGRLDPILARGGAGGDGAINPDDLTAITRGEEVYASYCLSCHGAELRGDGPAATGMQPPPADFSAPHTRAHDDATLIYWVRNGKQGTAMPAFAGKLSDEEIAAVLSYIARQQREMDAATPVP
jgi:mono/diheme cytochrome c family protein/methionine-rich copper-binding protein CopC